MDGKYIMFIYVILLCITVVMLKGVSTDGKSVLKVTLYTDLVDIISKNSSCSRRKMQNTTEEGNLYSKQGIVISRYNFHDVDVLRSAIGKCDIINIRALRYGQFNWTCFATGKATSPDTNWLFVDCVNFQILTIKCLEHVAVLTILNNLCKKSVKTWNNKCKQFSYGKNDSSAVCSQNFRLRKTFLSKSDDPPNYTTVGDIAAYLCAAFILVTFLLAILIPAEKCKPTYIYDKEQERRVPLEIYEMYGVEYKPAAKKRRTRKSLNMGSVPAISSHMGNVALVANNPVDWKGHKIKFNFHQHQPLFNPVILGLAENKKANEHDQMPVRNQYFSRRKNSTDSIETVGTFDYSMFQNQVNQCGENMTSERRKCLNIDDRRYSFHQEEPRHKNQNGRIGTSFSLSENLPENEEEVMSTENEEHNAKWSGNKEMETEEQSPVCFTIYAEIDERGSQSSSGNKQSHCINQENSVNNIINNEGNEVIGEIKKCDASSKGNESLGNVDIGILENENEEFASAMSIREADMSRDTISNDTTEYARLETINECPNTLLSSVEETSAVDISCRYCSKGNQNDETNNMQNYSRAHISITVELPNTSGCEHVQSDGKLVLVNQENRSRFSRRSFSRDEVGRHGQIAVLKRKYSLC